MERARKVKKMWHEIYALLQEGKSMPNAVEEVNYPLTRRGATVAAVLIRRFEWGPPIGQSLSISLRKPKTKSWAMMAQSNRWLFDFLCIIKSDN